MQGLPQGEIVAAMIAGEAELCLAFDVPPDQRLRILATVACPFGVVVTPGHKLANSISLRLSELFGYPVILPTPA